MTNITQGGSITATPIKQDGLRGIASMLAMMRSKWNGSLVFADLYCGSGENKLPGEIIAGSPISVLAGIADAVQNKLQHPPKSPVAVLFNDIAPGRAKNLLPENIKSWQEENGYQVDENNLHCVAKDGSQFKIQIFYREGCSSSALDEIVKFMEDRKSSNVILIVDPNGPKDAPWEKLKQIWEDYQNRLEIIFHVAATPLKRVYGARGTLGNDFFSYMPDHIGALIETFAGADGWVREPVGKDQWTMLLLSKHPPSNGWSTKNAQFHKIGTDQGKHVIRRLSLTNKNLEQAA